MLNPKVLRVVNRECHVSASTMEVIRHVVSRLQGGLSGFKKLSKRDRRSLILDCVAAHNQNRRRVLNGIA